MVVDSDEYWSECSLDVVGIRSRVVCKGCVEGCRASCRYGGVVGSIVGCGRVGGVASVGCGVLAGSLVVGVVPVGCPGSVVLRFPDHASDDWRAEWRSAWG